MDKTSKYSRTKRQQTTYATSIMIVINYNIHSFLRKSIILFNIYVDDIIIIMNSCIIKL